MTLGIFLPLVLAAVAVIDLVAFRIMLARGKISERLFNLLSLASVSLPLLAYIILTVIVPSAGAVQMF